MKAIFKWRFILLITYKQIARAIHLLREKISSLTSSGIPCCQARQRIIYNRLWAVDWLCKYCFIQTAIKLSSRAKYLHKVTSFNFTWIIIIWCLQIESSHQTDSTLTPMTSTTQKRAENHYKVGKEKARLHRKRNVIQNRTHVSKIISKTKPLFELLLLLL